MSDVWRRVQAKLRWVIRINAHRKICPSFGTIDLHIVKNSERGIPGKGFDGKQKINGLKHHIVMDTMGLLMSVAVTAANVHKSVAAE